MTAGNRLWIRGLVVFAVVLVAGLCWWWFLGPGSARSTDRYSVERHPHNEMNPDADNTFGISVVDDETGERFPEEEGGSFFLLDPPLEIYAEGFDGKIFHIGMPRKITVYLSRRGCEPLVADIWARKRTGITFRMKRADREYDVLYDIAFADCFSVFVRDSQTGFLEPEPASISIDPPLMLYDADDYDRYPWSYNMDKPQTVTVTVNYPGYRSKTVYVEARKQMRIEIPLEKAE